MYLYLLSINDKVFFVELLEFTQSTSQRLCQHFHSKVKVSYFILNVKWLHYSFSLPFKRHFLNCLYLCWLFIGAVCSSVSRMRWLWGCRDFCIFLPLNLSARGAEWEDRCASAERAGSARKIRIGLSWDSLHLFKYKGWSGMDTFFLICLWKIRMRMPASMPAIEKVTVAYCC